MALAKIIRFPKSRAKRVRKTQFQKDFREVVTIAVGVLVAELAVELINFVIQLVK